MRRHRYFIGLFASFALVMSGCGGGGYSPPPTRPSPTILLSATSLNFSAVQGGANPASQTFTVSNSGASGSTLTYSVSKTQNWLTLGGDLSGNLASGRSASVSVNVNISGMNAGTYADTVTITAAGATNTPRTVAVTLTVTLPTIDSVVVSPASTTLVSGETQQFTAAVMGTGNYNSAVTWSATGGTISADGLFTAPTVSAVTVFTVTATSEEDTTKFGTATATVNSPPATIVIAPDMLAFSAVQGGANPASQTFTITNSGPAGSMLNYTATKSQVWLTLGGAPTGSLPSGQSASVSVNVNISGMNAGTYSDTVTITAAGATNTPRTIAVTLTVAVPPDPTISISPAAATMQYGASSEFTLEFANNSAPPLCSVTSGPGSVSVSADGAVATYNLPLPTTITISVWSAEFTCSVTNSVGKTATAVAAITLQYDTPVISSISPPGIFCQMEICMVVVNVTGSGFYAGGTLFIDSTPITLTASYVSNPTRIGFIMAFDTPRYDPHRFMFSIASPADGHGGGTSDTAYLGFYGNQNTAAVSSTEVFQSRYTTGVYKFRLSNGGSDGIIPYTVHARGISVDDKSGNLLYSQGWHIGEITPGGKLVGGAGFDHLPVAVAANGGYGCAAHPFDGLLTSLDLFQLPYMNPITMAIGDSPWNVAMAKLGDKFACVAFNAGDLQLSVVKIPETQLWNSATFVGLTPLGELRSPPDGGWQLAILEVSPTMKIAAVLSQHDKLVVFKQIQLDETGQLVTIGDLSAVPISWPIGPDRSAADAPLAIPFRITADNIHGTFIVAVDDYKDGVTRFGAIDPMTGVMTQLEATTPKLAVGLAVSPLDGRIVGCERDTCDFLPNQ